MAEHDNKGRLGVCFDGSESKWAEFVAKVSGRAASNSVFEMTNPMPATTRGAVKTSPFHRGCVSHNTKLLHDDCARFFCTPT